jgi:sugar phosphate isomerase/epimerase
LSKPRVLSGKPVAQRASPGCALCIFFGGRLGIQGCERYYPGMIPAIWTAMYAELSTTKALATLHDHGWRAFELSTEHINRIETAADTDRRIADVRRCLDELGIRMPQAHAFLKADVSHPDPGVREAHMLKLCRQTDIASRLGIRILVVHPGRSSDVATPGERKNYMALNTQAFRRLGDLAGENDMRIGLENMMRRGAAAAYELLELLEAIGHTAIGVVLDTSHANVADVDLPGMIDAFGELLIGTHISDNDGSGDQHLTPGGGRIDWLPVVKALMATGYDALFNLEIPGERHSLLPIRELKSRHALMVAEKLLGLCS